VSLLVERAWTRRKEKQAAKQSDQQRVHQPKDES
jgi:hypothetical protein